MINTKVFIYKRCLLVLLLTSFVSMFVACGKAGLSGENKPSGMNNRPSDVAHPTENITPTTNTYITDTPDADDNHIVWELHFSSPVYEEAQAEIRSFLAEKGIDCHIDFVSDGFHLCGSEYAEWINKQQDANQSPDIINSNAFENTTLAYRFVEQEFYPLNDFLETDAGKQLYDAYADVEWKRIAVNGNIYTMPWRRELIDSGIYIYVNNAYLDSFHETYNGTYASLREALFTVSDKKLVLASYGLDTCFWAFDDYYTLFGLNYHCEPDGKMGRIEDPSQQAGAKEYLQMIYNDYKDGVLKPFVSPEEMADNIYAYFSNKKLSGLDGFTEVVVQPDMFHTSKGMSYGILSSSKHKKLAFEVLAACYSDPRIASLLWWGYSDEEEWKERDQWMRTCKPSAITGFIPYYSEDEWNAIHKVSSSIGNLFSYMYNTGNGNAYRISSDYETYLDRYFSTSHDYSEVINLANQRLEEWYSNKLQQ